MALRSAFHESGIAILPDGEKFERVLPKELAGELSRTRKSGDGVEGDAADIPAGAIHMQNVDVKQLAAIYGDFIGRKQVPSGDLVGKPVALKTRNPLTRGDAFYAFETLLEWRDLKLVLVGDDSFTFVRTHGRR